MLWMHGTGKNSMRTIMVLWLVIIGLSIGIIVAHPFAVLDIDDNAPYVIITVNPLDDSFAGQATEGLKPADSGFGSQVQLSGNTLVNEYGEVILKVSGGSISNYKLSTNQILTTEVQVLSFTIAPDPDATLLVITVADRAGNKVVKEIPLEAGSDTDGTISPTDITIDFTLYWYDPVEEAWVDVTDRAENGDPLPAGDYKVVINSVDPPDVSVVVKFDDREVQSDLDDPNVYPFTISTGGRHTLEISGMLDDGSVLPVFSVTFGIEEEVGEAYTTSFDWLVVAILFIIGIIGTFVILAMKH